MPRRTLRPRRPPDERFRRTPPRHAVLPTPWPDGERFDYAGDAEALEAEIRRIAPGDLAGYRRFHEYTKKVYAKGYDELAAVPFLRFWDMCASPRNWRGCAPTGASTPR